MKRTLEKISILSLSLMLITTYSVSSVIPMMLEHFSDHSRTEVEQLIPITSFAIMIMIMLNTWLSKIISERLSIILGMSLIAVAGTVPVFVQQYEIMFFSRVLLGVGIGLVNAYALHMINERYEGAERASLLGYRAAMEGLGSAVLTLIAGQLLGFGWNYAFLIYIAGLPILVLYLCFVPKSAKNAEKKAAGRKESVSGKKVSEKEKGVGTSSDIKAYLGFLLTSMFLAVLAICMNSSSTMRIPGLVVEQGIGTETQSSVVLSAMMITSIVGGVFFGKLNQLLKEKMTAACMLAYGVGMLLIAGAGNMVILGIGAMLAGAAQNLIVTALFNNISGKLPSNLVKIGTTFVLVGCNLGSSCSAIVLTVIGFVSEKMSASFVVYAAIMLGLGVIMLCQGAIHKSGNGK